MKVRVKKMVNIHGQGYEQGKEYDVDESLGKWMIEKEIAEEVTPSKPKKEVCQPAYHKLLELVGPHLIEIYGSWNTGKSRLVHSIATEAQLIGKRVLFLDTEAGLEDKHIEELQNYEYIGDKLDTLIKRVSEAKDDRKKFDLLIVDSIGHPVYVHYVEMEGLEEQLRSFQKLALLFRDMVRFARGEKGADFGKREALAIAVNHTVSEFARAAKNLPRVEPLDPFGGQIHRVPKLILRSEPAGFTSTTSIYKLLSYKARDLPKNYEVAQFTIDHNGVRIEWRM